MKHPIPDAALDDRLGFLGMTGSGKTFGAGSCVERILSRHGRVIIPDPLGVWWGLRSMADGKTPSPYDIVIFGGAHADMPVTLHAGAIIGEAVATMRESAILDLSQFETAASERRFMLSFLDAIYRKTTGEPVHLIFDEADMWAPEKIADKEGEATKLHGMMQSVVRRGRVKGLTSWLISQRPAALSKQVLSQVDGLVAFRLTASQDRKALGLWIEGQADREQGKAILGRLPTKARGEAVVWLPARGVLDDVTFPMKETYDSSRAPKRGEKRHAIELKPLDTARLKEKLATVEAETKANDPKALRAEIAALKRQMAEATAAAAKAGHIPDPQAIEEAERRGYEAGLAAGTDHVLSGIAGLAGDLEASSARVADEATRAKALFGSLASFLSTLRADVAKRPTPRMLPAPATQPKPKLPPIRQPNMVNGSGDVSLTGPQRQLLKALAWWKAMGHDRPSRPQVAAIAGWKITSGHLKNIVGSLRTAELVTYPTEGVIEMTPAGAASAPEPDMGLNLHDGIRSVLSGPQRQIFDTLIRHGGRPLARETIAEQLGWEPTSGHLKNVVGSLRTLEVIEYPTAGQVSLQEWVTA